MRLFTHSISIARPREAVFDHFIDFGRAPSWRAYVTSIAPAEAGPVHAGSVLRVLMDIGGEAYSFDMTVLACERPTLWRHRSNETDFDGFIEYRFDTEPGGTRVTMSCEITPRGMWGWLALPMMWLNRGKSYRDQLPKLKIAVEGGQKLVAE